MYKKLVDFVAMLFSIRDWFFMVGRWTWRLPAPYWLLMLSIINEAGVGNIPPVADGKKEKVSKMAAQIYLSAGKQ